MTTLTEGNLETSRPQNAEERKFDDRKTRDLLRWMKAANFVVDEDH